MHVCSQFSGALRQINDIGEGTLPKMAAGHESPCKLMSIKGSLITFYTHKRQLRPANHGRKDWVGKTYWAAQWCFRTRYSTCLGVKWEKEPPRSTGFH